MRKLTALLVVALLASSAGAAMDLPVIGEYWFEETIVGEGSMMHPDGMPGYAFWLSVYEDAWVETHPDAPFTVDTLELRFEGDFFQWEHGGAWYQTLGADTMFNFESGDVMVPVSPIVTEDVLQAPFYITNPDKRIGPGESAIAAWLVTDEVPTVMSFATGAEDYPVGAEGTYGLEGYFIPEPATLSLLALGGVAALIRRRR